MQVSVRSMQIGNQQQFFVAPVRSNRFRFRALKKSSDLQLKLEAWFSLIVASMIDFIDARSRNTCTPELNAFPSR